MQNEQPPLGIGENPKIRLKTFLIFMQADRFPARAGRRFWFFQKIFQKGIDFFPKT